jgi:pyruvate ferredoxin oxidoreductase gamma subunit
VKKLTEVRWHARGGQGAVTAAKLLAEAALAQGLYIQAFPEYGPERMGAPIQAFTRLSREPIYVRSNVTEPDIVVVLDQTLLATVNIVDGLSEEGLLLVNSERTPVELRKELGLKSQRVGTVDATRIALKHIGRAIPNTPMMGALIKATNIMTLEQLLANIEKSLAKKVSQKVVAGNIAAVKEAYKEVKLT